MATLTHKIEVQRDGELRIDDENSSAKTKYWVKPEYVMPKHDFYPIRPATENLKGAPDVFRTGNKVRPESYSSAPMDIAWQFFNADLMSLARFGMLFKELEREERKYIANAFTSVFGNRTAFCNNSGFGNKEPKANYIKNKDLEGDLPRFHPLICGTDTITGTKVGSFPQSGAMMQVDSWNFRETPPQASLSTLRDSRVRWATIIYSAKYGNTYKIGKFPHLGEAYGVPYAFITFKPTYYYLECLEEYQGPRRGLYNPEKPFPY